MLLEQLWALILQGQVGWGLEHPGLVSDIPTMAGNEMIFKGSSNPNKSAFL